MDNGIVIAACTGVFFAFTPSALVLVAYLVERVRSNEAQIAHIEQGDTRQLAIAKERKHNDV